MKKKLIKLCLSAGIALGISGAANAHLVTFGWQDNGNGTVTLWGEHWHGDQSVPSTANGGITISSPTSAFTPYQVQWAGVLNNVTLATLVGDGTLVGYGDAGNPGSGTEHDWFFTDPLVLGNGDYDFFTGTNCCIDTMGAPVRLTVTGITSVDPGTGPGDVSVPEAGATVSLLGLSLLGLFGFARRKARA